MSGSTSSKYLLRESSLLRLYSISILSFVYFMVQLVVAHIAHSLILQVDAYHMLYNILALGTSIITTTMCRNAGNVKNTFGWTRIDVCGAVASLCFLSALCFSVLIESLQAMLHASHHEKMTRPEWVGAVGVAGIGVNLAALAIVGGYSYQQKGFLGSHKEGEDIVISPSARRGPKNSQKLSHFGLVNIFRDFFGCILVICCSIIVYLYPKSADLVDPMLCILEIIMLGILSFRYAREAGYILLLTIPHHINVQDLMKELYEGFPEVCNVHEFHVWQLTPARIIASAHIVLRSKRNCWAVQNNIVDFLQNRGISHITLQPEFLELDKQSSALEVSAKRSCFLPCSLEDDACLQKKCCTGESSPSLFAVPTSSTTIDPRILRTASLPVDINSVTVEIESLETCPKNDQNVSTPLLSQENSNKAEDVPLGEEAV